ncbi:MAG: hypothetical protein Kow002_14980 [Anaerolineales bacterium]
MRKFKLIIRLFGNKQAARQENLPMTKNLRIVLSCVLLSLWTTACLPKPDPNAQIRQAVAATVAAIPTYTPYPTTPPHPSPTPMHLRGLFCEYQFCIVHPPDVAFFDVNAQRNPASPNTYSQGILAAFNANLFIQMFWQHAAGTSDPKFLLDLILEDGVDERTGNMDIMLIRNMNVLYTPISTSATPVLPYGGAAAWTCGERVFAWKTYTPQDGQAQTLFEEALQGFRCDNQ